MKNYQEYFDDFERDYFNRALPGYLLNEGTTLYNEWKFHWDLYNNMIAAWVDNRLKPLDLLQLLVDYYIWVEDDEGRKSKYILGDYGEDEEFRHYWIINTWCSFYGIKDIHPLIGKISLAHRIRLLKIAARQRMFDGSKRAMKNILEDLNFGSGIGISIVTQTGDDDDDDNSPTISATAHCYITKPNSEPSVEFNMHDEILFENGYYNLEILGIVYEFTVLSSDALVYDIETHKYDDDKKYDKGGN